MLPREPALANAASHGSGSGVGARVSLRCIAIRLHCLRCCSRRHRRGRAKESDCAAGRTSQLPPSAKNSVPAITIKTRATNAYPASAGGLFDLNLVTPARCAPADPGAPPRPSSRRCLQKVHLSAVCVSWLMACKTCISALAGQRPGKPAKTP